MTTEGKGNPKAVAEAQRAQLARAEAEALYALRNKLRVRCAVICIREGRRKALRSEAVRREERSAGQSSRGAAAGTVQERTGVRRAKIIEWPKRRG